jgi:hypothetical protein
MKIGNGAGFWGDDIGAAARLLSSCPDLDYLNFDYLAEVSMSIMAFQRQREPSSGYAGDFAAVVATLIPYWKKGGQCKLITNGGGLNPLELGRLCKRILDKEKISLKIAVIEGDDVVKQLLEHPEEPLFHHLDDGRPLSTVHEKLVTANAYLGASPIAEALARGAGIVISGRIADPSLTVGPCLHHFKWDPSDYHKIAGATVAGHLLECGTQVTGGISTDWLSLPHLENIGFPITEIDQNGSFVITKGQNTGGRVSLETVKEQLLYEILDPACYKSPDCTLSFLELQVKAVGEDRVQVQGALGSAPPPNYKVSATYHAGYRADGQLALFGDQVHLKAEKVGEILLKKMAERGFILEKSLVEVIGGGALVPGMGEEATCECLLRIAALDSRPEALELFSKLFAPFVTAGPQGTTGYFSGRPAVRPVFGFWPCLIKRSHVRPSITILEEP